MKEAERCVRLFNLFEDEILCERCWRRISQISNDPCIHRSLSTVGVLMQCVYGFEEAAMCHYPNESRS